MSRSNAMRMALLLVAVLAAGATGWTAEPHEQPRVAGVTPDDLLKEYLKALGDSYGFRYGEYHFYDQEWHFTTSVLDVVRRAVEQFPAHPTTDLMLRHVRLLSDRRDGRIAARDKQEGRKKAGANAKEPFVKTYKVADLVKPLPAKTAGTNGLVQMLAPSSEKEELDSLVELIIGTIQPASWETAGGNGSITRKEARRTLVVRQTRPVHKEIADLLAELRRLSRVQLAMDLSLVDAPSDVIGPKLLGKGVKFGDLAVPRLNEEELEGLVVRRPQAKSLVEELRKPKEEQLDSLVLLPPQAKQLLEELRKDSRARVSVQPRTYLPNGGIAQIGAAKDSDSPGAAAIVQIASGDGRMLRVLVRVGERYATLYFLNEPLACIGISGGATLVVDLPPDKPSVTAIEKQPPKTDSKQEPPAAAAQPVSMRKLLLVTACIAPPAGNNDKAIKPPCGDE